MAFTGLWIFMTVALGLAFAQGSNSCNRLMPFGTVCKPSPYSAKDTINRFENIIRSKNLTVFTRISHSDNAAGINVDLKPTELIIFGNPRLGSPLMLSQQSVGIDLPMKALAYEDENGATWLLYNAPSYLTWRHSIVDRSEIVQKMTGALDKLTNAAIATTPGK